MSRTWFSLPALALTSATALLVMLAVQYPFSTSFPIGGDAAITIIRARALIQWDNPVAALAALWQSRYPLIHGLFNVFGLLPTGWPERFIWAMVSGHIVTGLALGYLLARLFGIAEAAAGMALWALTTTDVQPHFESATLAHLWSLPVLLLFLERWHARAPGQAALAAAATFLSHPLSALVLTATALLYVPASLVVPPRSREEKKLAIGGALLLTLALLVVVGIAYLRPTVLDVVRSSEAINPIPNAVRSHIGPAILLAPAGLARVLYRVRRRRTSAAVLVAFATVVLFTNLQSLGGQAAALARFNTYLILGACLFAGAALPAMIRRALPSPLWQLAGTSLLLGALAIWSWQTNAAIYRHYESPSRYARLHPDEHAAFLWLADHVAPGSHLISSEANRHTEWLPVLTGHTWHGLPDHHPLWSLEGDELTRYIARAGYTHLVVLHHRESLEEMFRKRPPAFPVVFQNDAVTVVALCASTPC